MLFVQRAEDASLVSGGDPVRLTLTRTANSASWFAAPPQRRAGTLSTEQMMLTLGWRPASDGSTAPLPGPRPQALLAHAQGTLAFTVNRATVRADGTLVLDIDPIGGMPATVQSFGAVSLSIDGVPGVRVQRTEVTADLFATVTVTGARADQALVQFTSPTGEILATRFLAADRPEEQLQTIGVDTGARLIETVLQLRPPSATQRGRVQLTGIAVLGETQVPLVATLARWTLPPAR